MIYWSGQLENFVKKKCKVILTISKKATKHLYDTDERQFVRIKGSIQDNKELFLAYLEEVKKCRKDEIANGSLDWKELVLDEYLYHNEIPCIQYFSDKSDNSVSYHMYQIGNFSYIE